MEYRCLRNCFVDNQYYQKGVIYELSDDVPKYEKNFAPIIDAVPVVNEEPQGNTEKVEAFAPESFEIPREPKPSEYFCPKCQTIHRKNSKLGKRHLKHKRE